MEGTLVNDSDLDMHVFCLVNSGQLPHPFGIALPRSYNPSEMDA